MTDSRCGYRHHIVDQQQPLLRSLRIAYLEMGRWTVTILSYVGDMITGRMKADISDPVGIVVITGSAAQEGLASLMRLVVLLNINLGLFNLFPIPLLDGFWLVLFVYEAIRRPLLRTAATLNAQAVGLSYSSVVTCVRYLPRFSVSSRGLRYGGYRHELLMHCGTV